MQNNTALKPKLAKILGIVAISLGILVGIISVAFFLMPGIVFACIIVSVIISILAIIFGARSHSSGGRLGWILGSIGLVPPILGLLVFGIFLDGLRPINQQVTAEVIKVILNNRLPNDSVETTHNYIATKGTSCDTSIALKGSKPQDITNAISTYYDIAAPTSFSVCPLSLASLSYLKQEAGGNEWYIKISHAGVINEAGPEFWKQLSPYVLTQDYISVWIEGPLGGRVSSFSTIIWSQSSSFEDTLTQWNKLRSDMTSVSSSTNLFPDANVRLLGCPLLSGLSTPGKVCDVSDAVIIDGPISINPAYEALLGRVSSIDARTQLRDITLTSTLEYAKYDEISVVDGTFTAVDPKWSNVSCNQLPTLHAGSASENVSNELSSAFAASNMNYKIVVMDLCGNVIYSGSNIRN